MRKSEIDFLREVFYPDIADITTTLEHVGTSSIVLQQQIVQRAAVVCTARSVWVNTAAGGATPIPANVAALLSNL
jgi:acyl-CoA thioesterase FadM